MNEANDYTKYTKMKKTYLISIFENGKNTKSYFSESLCELASIKASNQGCEINVFDVCECKTLTWEQARQIASSAIEESTAMKPASIRKSKKKKRKSTAKGWQRKIRCVETGIVYDSISDCSKALGISHKVLWNAINSGKPRFGYHFVNVKNKKRTK